jgi:MFS family permease
MEARGQGLIRSLRHRDYRLFFGAFAVSAIGVWMIRTATSWLVFRLTGSASMLGIAGFAAQAPILVIAPLAGVLLDRLDRRRLLVVTQLGAMAACAALAVLTLSGRIAVWHIVAIGVFQGVVFSLDEPARKSLVSLVVPDRADLANALALTSALPSLARLVGPPLATALIVARGEGWCFSAGAVTYLALVGALLLMRTPPVEVSHSSPAVLGQLQEGARYIAATPSIRAVLALLAWVALVGTPYQVLMPLYATQTFGGGAQTYGTLMGATGLGAITGLLLLASRASVLNLGRTIFFSAALFGVGLVGLFFVKHFALALAAMFLCGAGNIVQIVASTTLSQTVADSAKLGRVMSFHTMAFFGVLPFGNLLAGQLADAVGSKPTLLAGGIGCLMAAAVFSRQLHVIRGDVAARDAA